MLVVMQHNATDEQVQNVIDRMVTLDYTVHRSTGFAHTVLGGVGPADERDPMEFAVMDGVKEAHRVAAQYRLASRGFHAEDTVVEVGTTPFGGKAIATIAGTIVIESETSMQEAAALVAEAGGKLLFGGARKLSPTPYTEEQLRWLVEAARQHGLQTAVEAVEGGDVDILARNADVLLVGGRNMCNFALLREIAASGKPVVLKRGVAHTVDELLVSAEYLLSAGNSKVILCEQGIRTFDTHTRSALDLSAILTLKRLSHLPVIADPSNATGRRDQVVPLARAAIAAGADGLLIEVRTGSLSSGAQTVDSRQFGQLMRECSAIATILGRVF